MSFPTAIRRRYKAQTTELCCTVDLLAPVLTGVLAATAVPIELRPSGQVALDFGFFASDVLANVAGYVPVGIVLATFGPRTTLLVAGLMATFAEMSQFVMMHRDPSVADVGANVTGAVLGLAGCRYWEIRSTGFRLTRPRAIVASVLACALILGIRMTSGYAPSSRGFTSAGTLEAHWKLDESSGEMALDSSGHGLHGTFSREPKRVPGVLSGAVTLDGVSDYIDFGRSTSLRLAGSMTVSAWIKPTSFPFDDAAIVSSQSGQGYQLDATVDRGPRTIGFKLATSCGRLMARYGATPLVAGTWYHVAGVYNAEGRTLDVYLNGELDNGFLLGPVTGGQRSANQAVYVGRRSDRKGFEFVGLLDDVRIYSRALTKADIVDDMHGTELDRVTGPQRALQEEGSVGNSLDRDSGFSPCGGQSDFKDARLPGVAAALGVLIAVAFASLWPSAGWLLCLGASFAAGFLLLPGGAPALPALGYCLVPLMSLAGGASVIASRPTQRSPD